MSQKFLQDFLVHYQDMRGGDYLNFWNRLQDFKKIKEKRSLTGHASLIYQKYLKPNAYIYVDCFTSEQRKSIENIIDTAIEENKDLGDDVFDDMLKILEEEMVKTIFKPFFRNPFYVDYLNARSLEEGFELKSIEVAS